MWLAVVDDFRETLRRAGVTDPAQLMHRDALAVVRQSERAIVRRIVFDPAHPTAVFLKQYRHRSRHFLRRSRARREWDNLTRLERLRLPVPRALAAGEERRLGCSKRSFLVTEEVPGCVGLEPYVRDLDRRRDTPARRRLIPALARLVADMHHAGFVHHDLHWRNILVRPHHDGSPQVFLLDCPRGSFPRTPWRRRHGVRRDLACLDRFAPGHFSRTERLRFYLAYVEREHVRDRDRSALRGVAKAVGRLQRRSRRSGEIGP